MLRKGNKEMHEHRYLDFSCRKSEETILKECAQIADREGDYKGQIKRIRLTDQVLRNRGEAEVWISCNDNGWYDNLGIKYKDGRKTMWLVKIEYHC